MATVIGIFEDFYLRKKPFSPVVRPGSQTRRFTQFRIQLKYAIKLGGRISVNTIVFRIGKAFLF